MNSSEVIEELKAKLIEQQKFIERISQPPFIRGVVAKVTDKGVMLSSSSGLVEVPVGEGFKVKIGDIVRCNPKTSAIIEIVKPTGTPTGQVVSVSRVIDSTSVEVEMASEPKVITSAVVVQRGDRVVVDEGGNVIVGNLGKAEESYQVPEETNVSWSDIGGLIKAKEELQEAIEGPIKHAKLFAEYGKKPVKGVLLYGPPGCGKTMLAKAAATSLAKLYGRKTSQGFFYVKGPEILSKWVGQTEATIRQLFTRAREHFQKEGYQAVLFIDEAESLLSYRGSEGPSGMEKTIVPMFLAEMDGLDKNGPLVLLATNRADQLDAAIVRDGRIDRKIQVMRPTPEDSLDLFKMYLKGKPVFDGSTAALAKEFVAATFGSELKFRISGAMVAGLVDQAVSLAMRRDMSDGKGARGIKVDDVKTAVESVIAQYKDLR